MAFDFATTAGATATLGPPPGDDATVVRRLRAAGATLVDVPDALFVHPLPVSASVLFKQ